MRFAIRSTAPARAHSRAVRSAAMIVLATVPACAGRAYTVPALAPLPWPADTVRAQVIADGVTLRTIYSPQGPWSVRALDVDLTRCNAPIAVKGRADSALSAVGRVKPSESLTDLMRHERVVGGVNGDFFSLTAPLGVPTGALVVNGTVLAGPSDRPVIAVDSDGVVRFTTLDVRGQVSSGSVVAPVAGWNRDSRTGVAWFDPQYASRTDTASGAIEIAVSGRHPSRVVAIDTLTAGIDIPRDGGVIIAGAHAPAATRAAFRTLRIGDAVSIDVALTPRHPRDVVGGRPMLVRDGVVNVSIDSGGPTSFNVGRNPRTAAGLADNGRRLILAVVDGRQPRYSDGMSLRELATLMVALGARDAINLDGGGSTSLVYMDPATSMLRIANRPSDKQGERAVGDALAIVKRCR